jgi:hypothetical protein
MNQNSQQNAIKRIEGGLRMPWELIFVAGFIALWLFVLPRMGLG